MRARTARDPRYSRGVRARRATVLLTAVGLSATGCGGGPSALVVASTTSLHDSGLLDVLVPAFEKAHPEHAVRVIAVGSGEALALGRRGDVDLVLVHSPRAERAFLDDGHGTRRIPFLRNDFVIAGPAQDPAGVRGMPTAEATLSRIATARARFVSRGDASGTHEREQELWRHVGSKPAGEWYEEVGQGMGATLLIAGERLAYVLTDRATLQVMTPQVSLDILVANDPALENTYAAIEVARAANPVGACLLAHWLTGPEARALIRGFGGESTGPLFEPIEESTEMSVPSAQACAGANAP